MEFNAVCCRRRKDEEKEEDNLQLLKTWKTRKVRWNSSNKIIVWQITADNFTGQTVILYEIMIIIFWRLSHQTVNIRGISTLQIQIIGCETSRFVNYLSNRGSYMVVILSESLLVGIDSLNWLKLRSLKYTQTTVSRNC